MKYAEEETKEEGKESTGVLAREREMPSPEPGTVGGPSPAFDIEAAKKHFKQYLQVVDDMFTKAKAMIINNEVTNKDATELGTTAMTLFNKIRAAKAQVPFYTEAKEYVDAVDATATMLMEKLYSTRKGTETIVSIMKGKISQYIVVLESQRREQEALERKAREDLQKQLDEKAKQTGTKAPKVEGPLITGKQETTVRTSTGASYATHHWTFEVEDRDLPKKMIQKLISLLYTNDEKVIEDARKQAKTLDLLMPYLSILYSDTDIRAAIKNGLRNIQGLRIFEETGTRFKAGK